MPTYSALTTLPGEEAAQSLALAMERMDPEPTGVGVFEIEDGSGLWEVGGYFLEPPDEVMLEVLATAFGFCVVVYHLLYRLLATRQRVRPVSDTSAAPLEPLDRTGSQPPQHP